MILSNLRCTFLPPNRSISNTLYSHLEQLQKTSNFYVMAQDRRARAQVVAGSDNLCDDGQKELIRTEGFVPISFIRQCVLKAKFMEPDPYRRKVAGISPPAAAQTSADDDLHNYSIFDDDDTMSVSSVGTLRGRTKYTRQEDMTILEYIQQHKCVKRVRGKELWKEMERRKVTSHTSESMRSRYLKTILPRIHTYQIPAEFRERLTGKQKRVWADDDEDDDDDDNSDVSKCDVSHNRGSFLAPTFKKGVQSKVSSFFSKSDESKFSAFFPKSDESKFSAFFSKSDESKFSAFFSKSDEDGNGVLKVKKLNLPENRPGRKDTVIKYFNPGDSQTIRSSINSGLYPMKLGRQRNKAVKDTSMELGRQTNKAVKDTSPLKLTDTGDKDKRWLSVDLERIPGNFKKICRDRDASQNYDFDDTSDNDSDVSLTFKSVNVERSNVKENLSSPRLTRNKAQRISQCSSLSSSDSCSNNIKGNETDNRSSKIAKRTVGDIDSGNSNGSQGKVVLNGLTGNQIRSPNGREKSSNNRNTVNKDDIIRHGENIDCGRKSLEITKIPETPLAAHISSPKLSQLSSIKSSGSSYYSVRSSFSNKKYLINSESKTSGTDNSSSKNVEKGNDMVENILCESLGFKTLGDINGEVVVVASDDSHSESEDSEILYALALNQDEGKVKANNSHNLADEKMDTSSSPIIPHQGEKEASDAEETQRPSNHENSSTESSAISSDESVLYPVSSPSSKQSLFKRHSMTASAKSSKEHGNLSQNKSARRSFDEMTKDERRRKVKRKWQTESPFLSSEDEGSGSCESELINKQRAALLTRRWKRILDDQPSTSKDYRVSDSNDDQEKKECVSKEMTRKRVQAIMDCYHVGLDEAIEFMIENQNTLWEIVE